MSIQEFHNSMTPYYRLIYGDWEQSVRNQARDLDKIIKQTWGEKVSSVLDVACGIGTQSLGLATLGYAVTASDISSDEVEEAKKEALRRGLSISQRKSEGIDGNQWV